MSWDLQIDFKTGDLLWNGIRDLGAAQGDALIQQRVHIRLEVQRGAWIWDRLGTLGSRLWTLVSQGIPATEQTIEMVVREALEPMDDIIITNLIINTYGDGSGVVDSPTTVAVQVEYQLVLAEPNVNMSDNTLTYSTPTFLVPV